MKPLSVLLGWMDVNTHKRMHTSYELQWYYKLQISFVETVRCVKNVRIRNFSGSYSVGMRENTDQKNSEYGRSLCSGKNESLKLIAS